MINRLLQYISRFDSHHRLMIALVVAGIAYFVVPESYNVPAHITAVWVAFAVTVLVLAWTSMLVAHPRDLPKLSQLQDSSRLFILVFVVVAAVASLFAVIALLNSMDKNRREHILLPILAVSSAWSLVHTVFIFRYAHLYYGNDRRPNKRPGGLDFPNEPEPDYLDFAYFSFVIGMTSQVSDVTIGSKEMRRTALSHGVLSFGFNAIIIALTISGLSK
ncbi:DUF1345 domain-containing protein [Spirosoma sp. HMF4905]|uniref:DUF1345 domain-containing protein n=1 Tax=Spirosoma arboris TaxID=2682092 RepID=A0A7K1SBA1_9BACT|nr:DUF1345 domain-containing protein [Spirosoma arboris]MVM30836.1 DUF1345 domain-containing protein [Spirosoma arboris]